LGEAAVPDGRHVPRVHRAEALKAALGTLERKIEAMLERIAEPRDPYAAAADAPAGFRVKDGIDGLGNALNRTDVRATG